MSQKNFSVRYIEEDDLGFQSLWIFWFYLFRVDKTLSLFLYNIVGRMTQFCRTNDPVGRIYVVEVVRERTEELRKQGRPCVLDDNEVGEVFPLEVGGNK